MLTCVCLNPCIDQTIALDTFHYGGLNRAGQVTRHAAGKGINVAISARRLGMQTQVTGLLPREGASIVKARLQQEGVAEDCVPTEGAVRTNIKLYVSDARITTEINQPGSPANAQALAQVMDKIRHAAQNGDALVFSGSVPPGTPQGIYAQMMGAAGAAICMLDAGGALLREGLKARPYLIKPNQEELSEYMRQPLTTRQQLVQAAHQLIREGAQHVCVSMGAQGAILTSGAQTYFAPSLPVPVHSTAGAGDAMLAALAQALLAQMPLNAALIRAVAAGTASAMSEGTDLLDVAIFKSLLPQISVQAI